MATTKIPNTLPRTATTSFSESSLFFLYFSSISLWANYEASKSFDITIVNDAKDSPAGRRFALSYVSNLLYPKKHIDSVTLRLLSRSVDTTVGVYAENRLNDGGKSFNGYVIEISPMLLENRRYDKNAIVGAILRGMVIKVWLWDGGPQGLVDGMAEYVAEMDGGGERPECEEGRRGWWWEDKDPTHVARLLHYCEEHKGGFIQRLNEAMRDTWHDRVVDDILGMPVMELCNDNNASWVAYISM